MSKKVDFVLLKMDFFWNFNSLCVADDEDGIGVCSRSSPNGLSYMAALPFEVTVEATEAVLGT